MGLTKPIEQYLCSNLLNLDTYILYLKDIIRVREKNGFTNNNMHNVRCFNNIIGMLVYSMSVSVGY